MIKLPIHIVRCYAYKKLKVSQDEQRRQQYIDGRALTRQKMNGVVGLALKPESTICFHRWEICDWCCMTMSVLSLSRIRFKRLSISLVELDLGPAMCSVLDVLMVDFNKD